MRNFLEVLADKFLAGVTQDLAKSAVYRGNVAIAVQQDHSDGSLLECGPEPFVALMQRLFRIAALPAELCFSDLMLHCWRQAIQVASKQAIVRAGLHHAHRDFLAAR